MKSYASCLAAAVGSLRQLLSLATVLAALPNPNAALAAAPLPQGCTEDNASACLYQPPIQLPRSALRVVDDMLLDPDRGAHPVPFRVRYPVGLDRAQVGLLPVVIFNHGGGTTTETNRSTPELIVTHGQLSSEERSESFARAGYVVFHIGRLPVQTLYAEHRQECDQAAPGMTDEVCAKFIGWHDYGARNVAFLVRRLQQGRWRAPADLDGRYDPRRIVVAGWSGGTEPGLNIAGAFQQYFRLRLPSVSIEGVVGFFMESPRGPTWGGFTSGFVDEYRFDQHSFFAIGSQPMLIFSGRGDGGDDPDGVPLARPASWFGAAPGGKTLIWTPQPKPDGPGHGTFDLKSEECTGRRKAYCTAFENAGIAWLDAVARSWPAAREWMDSDALTVVSRGRIEVHRR